MASVRLITLLLFGASGMAQAHVVVQPKTAQPGTRQTLQFVVGHGCDGKLPTTALRVEFPADVTRIEPQPKTGWTVVAGRSASGTPQLSWSGGQFAPQQADSFEVVVTLPQKDGPLTFPAFQSCGPTEVGWTELATAEGPKPTRPAPVLTLTTDVAEPPATVSAAPRPDGVQLRQGILVSPAGLPLYVFDLDTMAGMSHCVTECAATWRPFEVTRGAQPIGDWAPIQRDDGSLQWTYRSKPLYTYVKDVANGPATGTKSNWRPARP